MALTDQNDQIYSGDTAGCKVTVVDKAGASVDLTAATITWSIFDRIGGTAQVTKTSTAGDITIATNVLTWSLVPADTASLDGLYYHEGQATDAGADVGTFVRGWLWIKGDSA